MRPRERAGAASGARRRTKSWCSRASPPLSPRHRGPARAEGEMSDADARLWHPWLRINRVLRVMLLTRWSAEAWARVRVEFNKALALRSQIRRGGCGGVSALQGDLRDKE